MSIQPIAVTRPVQPSAAAHMPAEILLHIFQNFLSMSAQMQASRVCLSWRQACLLSSSIKNAIDFGAFVHTYSLSIRNHDITSHKVAPLLLRDLDFGPRYLKHQKDLSACIKAHMILGNFDSAFSLLDKGLDLQSRLELTIKISDYPSLLPEQIQRCLDTLNPEKYTLEFRRSSACLKGRRQMYVNLFYAYLRSNNLDAANELLPLKISNSIELVTCKAYLTKLLVHEYLKRGQLDQVRELVPKLGDWDKKQLDILLAIEEEKKYNTPFDLLINQFVNRSSLIKLAIYKHLVETGYFAEQAAQKLDELLTQEYIVMFPDTKHMYNLVLARHYIRISQMQKAMHWIARSRELAINALGFGVLKMSKDVIALEKKIDKIRAKQTQQEVFLKLLELRKIKISLQEINTYFQAALSQASHPENILGLLDLYAMLKHLID